MARNQSTLPAVAKLKVYSKRIRVLSTILLHQPHRELKDLKDLWVDNIVYTEHWRTFLGTQLQEWRSISLLVCFLRNQAWCTCSIYVNHYSPPYCFCMSCSEFTTLHILKFCIPQRGFNCSCALALKSSKLGQSTWGRYWPHCWDNVFVAINRYRHRRCDHGLGPSAVL